MKLPGALLALILVMQLTGCGGSALGPEEGRITFGDGSPVTSGSVEFRNRSTRERFTSRIESDGSFAPISGEGILGLPPGDYEIVVVQIVLTEDLAKEDHVHGNTVPRRYADYYTSDLQISVATGELDPIQIVIDL